MKKIFFYIIIASLLVVSGCDKKKTPKIFIEESLDSLLSNFIKDNPNDHIYSILFYNKNEKQFMEITSFGRLYYSRLVDKVFYKDGKLICYYSINRSWADSLLNIPASLLCTDSLKKYDDLSTGLIDYEGPLNTRTYRIFSKGKILPAKEDDFVCKVIASDTNVIKNEQINNILNSFINEHNPIITYIRFKHIKNKRYMCLGNDISYDKKGFIGMFYRNGRIVVLYSDINMADNDIVETKLLKSIKELSDYHIVHNEIPVYFQEEYCLKGDDLTEVSCNDPEYIKVHFN